LQDHYVVALAASAGGIKALTAIFSVLPADFPSPILVVQHLLPREPSHLVTILSQQSALKIRHAQNGDRLEPGSVYVAPPDRHLVVRDGGELLLSHDPKVHFVRPSADVLFFSVAAVYREKGIAVILSGTGMDGASGMEAVKANGGMTVAQDEATCEHFGMPSSAIRTGKVDFILPLSEIGPWLLKTVSGSRT